MRPVDALQARVSDDWQSLDQHLMNLKGTVALITGAKRIGAVVAEDTRRARRQRRAVVRAVARQRPRRGRIGSSTPRALRGEVFQADLSIRRTCAEARRRRSRRRFGRLDILVNMASVYTRARRSNDLTRRRLGRRHRTSICARHFSARRPPIPHMRRQGGGRIVNFSDWLATSGRPRYPGLSCRTTSPRPA